MELAAATLLAGRFAVDGAPIGSGATGVVWPATDLATGRAVVVQVLHPQLEGDPAAMARLQAAAAVAGRLSHPHVVEVLGVWSDHGRWLLASERVDALALQRHVIDPVAGVLVAERDAEVGRRQGRQREQPQRRKNRVVGGDGQDVIHPPRRGGETRLHEMYRPVVGLSGARHVDLFLLLRLSSR